jgi:uncharacterized protein YukE
MGDVYKVDVDGLINASSKVSTEATSLFGSHRASMVGLSDAESGWVGSSADALVAMAGKWQTIADKHTTAIDNQATHINTAAHLAKHAEEQAAHKLKDVGDQADSVNL